MALETYLSLRYAPVRRHKTAFLVAMVAAAFAAPLMRLFQIAFMAISNKPAMFGKMK